MDVNRYTHQVSAKMDRRAKLIRITERGYDMTSTAAQILRDMEAEFRAALGHARVDELRGTLQEIVAKVARQPNDAGNNGMNSSSA